MSQYIQEYLRKIQNSLLSWQATEHSYRPELRDLFVVISKLNVINEPKWSEHGKPDFIFVKWEWKEALPIAYAEAKDMHIVLEKIEKSEQLSRYFGYAKLVLTNGIEFRFYKNGIRYGEPVSLWTKKWNEITIHEENFGIFEDRFVDFLASPTDTIRRAWHLAEIMWWKARRIRDNMRDMMQNTEKYIEIWKLYNTFKTEILHDLTLHDFADLYAQTLVYGLFVARYHDKTQENFSRAEARDLVPKSNPLLRRFFDHIAWEWYEKRLEYIVDELCEVFSHADVHALMHGMYQKETHDPVIHFYEDFLWEYDSELRMQRWVFYTPAPVVKFIVRAIDDVLKTHFWLPKWLADSSKIPFKKLVKQDKKGKDVYENTEVHKVQVLDPATGTGTFLNEIVHHIFESMKWQEWMWANYVNKDLLPRLHGFELMMASYTIAHLKLWLTLAETGVENVEKRLQIYLTNSLEEARTDRETQMNIFGLGEAITLEWAYADEVKRDKPVMIVVWNPPYNWESKNKGKWIMKLMDSYKKEPNSTKKLKEKNSKFVNNDYVKFIRFAQYLVDKNKEGIIAFITSNSYLDSITFRWMRYNLMSAFNEIYILDLNWYSERPKFSEQNWNDKNVFDIKEWVSIIFAIKKSEKKIHELANLYFSELIWSRDYKYNFLSGNNINSISWKKLTNTSPSYLFIPQWEESDIYKSFFDLSEFFKVNSVWILTHRDKYSIDENKEVLASRIKEIFNSNTEELYNKYSLDKEWELSFNNISQWNIDDYLWDIKQYNFRVFDERYIIYNNDFIDRSRKKVLKNMLFENFSLIIQRQTFWLNFNHVFISNKISDLNFISNLWWGTVCPLYLYSDTENLDGQTRTPNLDITIWGKINETVWETTPEQILDYIYAVLHSPTYRETYKEFLKIDFPRVPYPTGKESFLELVKLWTELREMHLLASPKVQKFITTYPVVGTNEVVRVMYIDEKVYINDTQYFWNVPQVAWEFYIWGYQPAQKWLKDRKGRTLTWEDIEHYQQMIVALSETSRVMGEIDKVFKV